MNIKITQKDLQNTINRVFFIVGTSRSGSTLLQSMLSSHSEMVIPPETHFFHTYKKIQQKFQRAKNKKRFRDKLIDFWYSKKTRIADLGLSRKNVLYWADNLALNDPLDLFTLQLTMYRKKRVKNITGEKTPRHILHVKEILSVYPNAKIISLFRDPRATAYSEIKAKFGSPSVIVTTRRWRKYVEIHEQLEKELPENKYLMLRYGDLIENVKEELERICSFLGVNFEEQMLEYYNRDEKGFAEGEKSWKKGTLKPIQKDKNDEWKSALTNWQISLIDFFAGEYLVKMKYEKSSYVLSFPKNLYYQCVDFSKSIWATLTKSRYQGYKYPDDSEL